MATANDVTISGTAAATTGGGITLRGGAATTTGGAVVIEGGTGATRGSVAIHDLVTPAADGDGVPRSYVTGLASSGTLGPTNRFLTEADQRGAVRGFPHVPYGLPRPWKLTWDGATLTLAPRVMSPAPVPFRYVFASGKVQTVSAALTIVPTLTDRYIWITLDEATGLLVQSDKGFPGFDAALVASIGTNGAACISLLEEAHGVGMKLSEHAYLHSTVGCRYASGLSQTSAPIATNNTQPANAASQQIALSDGVIWDEDVQASITHSLTPTGTDWQQNLGVASPFAPGLIPVWYRTSTGSANWTRDAATNWPVKQGANSRLTYNRNAAGTWDTPELASGNYGVMWLFATPSIFDPVIAIMGQASYSSLALAQAATPASLSLGDFPAAEAKLVFGLIFQTYSSSGWSFGGGPRVCLRQVSDYRQASLLAATSFSATSHNALGGRSEATAHPAAAVTYDGTTSGLAATDVQAAIDELAAGGYFGGF